MGTLRGATERDRARLTTLSIPQTTVPTTREGDITPSAVEDESEETKRQESASGFTFFDPGRYEIEKSKRAKK